ncbi:unnamed protein product [Pocillopora meandrina]|uniref:Uncharacterized protein n=1 Tax=Pocillopora meandrina TaxID=46732 RepID=A0AAU9X1G1_9CNID|nr:unnamed protein product [Pocillopora meandrina]
MHYLNEQLAINNTQHNRSIRYASYNSICLYHKRETEGGLSFAVSATRLWNNVPLNIRKSDSIKSLSLLLFVDAGVSADGSWSQRGWSACDGVVAVISIDTRCFLVELMCNLQPNGKKATGRLHFQNGLLELGYPPQRKLFP